MEEGRKTPLQEYNWWYMCAKKLGIILELKKHLCYARFTLVDPMPWLASDVVGGKSGWNHPTSRRDPIYIGRMQWRAMRTFASVGARGSYNIVQLPGWHGEEVLFITTLNCVVNVRLPIGRRHRAILNMFNIARRPPDVFPMRPRQPTPGREPIHIGRADSIVAQSGRWINVTVVIVWMQPEFLHKQSLHHSMVCAPTFSASEQKCSNRWTKSAVGSCRLFRASTTQWNCKSSKWPTSWRSSTKSSDSSFSFSESITSFLVNTTIAFSSSLSSAWYENDTMQNFTSHHASSEQFSLYTK